MNLLPVFLQLDTVGSAINICILILAAYFVGSDSGADIRMAIRAAVDAAKRSLHLRRL